MNTKVKIILDHSTDTHMVFIKRQIAKENGEILRYFLNKEFKWTQYNETSNITDSVPRIGEDDIPMLAGFFVELQKVFGFNEQFNSPMRREVDALNGQLEAVKDHLNDMRVITFNKLGIETE